VTPRDEFLHKMYEQMFRDIAHQLSTVWQALTTVFGSFAIVALAEKGIVPIDFGVTIVVVLCAWFLMNVNDASYWYNRNLCIISNIERQFLTKSDLTDIVYYFGSHRPKNRMILQLKIQVILGTSLLMIVVLYHFLQRVSPGLTEPLSQFDFVRALPYVGLLGTGVALSWTILSRNAAYAEFLRNSPGRSVDTSSVVYGSGHGH
jgi:hypothetical protein